VYLWNNLPIDARNIHDFNLFKLYLEKDLPSPNKLFYLGKRKINIVLSRLRMKCSNLKAHLFELKIIENASCSCGYFYEDSVHFFFVCPLYNQQRTILHNKINPRVPFTLYTLLHGCKDLSIQENVTLYNLVLNFVENTKRFD
jgi:hypothetical protein